MVSLDFLLSKEVVFITALVSSLFILGILYNKEIEQFFKPKKYLRIEFRRPTGLEMLWLKPTKDEWKEMRFTYKDQLYNIPRDVKYFWKGSPRIIYEEGNPIPVEENINRLEYLKSIYLNLKTDFWKIFEEPENFWDKLLKGLLPFLLGMCMGIISTIIYYSQKAQQVVKK